MALTLDGIAAYVREYFDVEADEVTDLMIRRWATLGWSKINRKTKAWPDMESSVTISVLEGVQTYAQPLKDIQRIDEPVQWGHIEYLSVMEAMRRYAPPLTTTGHPRFWSLREGIITVWPIPDADYTLNVQGVRAPANPRDITTAVAIDLPTEDCEEALLLYVMYEACVHQDELEKAQVNRTEFDALMRGISADETGGSQADAIVLNRRFRYDSVDDRQPYPFESR